jgi:hypothetical protein
MSSPDPFQEAIQLAWRSFVMSCNHSSKATHTDLRVCKVDDGQLMTHIQRVLGDLTLAATKDNTVPYNLAHVCKFLIECGSDILFDVAELTEGLLLVEMGDLSMSIDKILTKAKSRKAEKYAVFDRQRDASGLEAIVALMDGNTEKVEAALGYFERENLTNVTLLRKMQSSSNSRSKTPAKHAVSSTNGSISTSATINDDASQVSAAHEHVPTLFFPFRNLIGTAFDGKFASMYARDLVIHFCGGQWFLETDEAAVSLAGSSHPYQTAQEKAAFQRQFGPWINAVQGLLRLFTSDLRHTDTTAAEVEKRLLANQLMKLAVASTEVRMRAHMFSQGVTTSVSLVRENVDALKDLVSPKSLSKTPAQLAASVVSTATASAAAAAAVAAAAASAVSPKRIKSMLKLTHEICEQLLERERFGATSAVTILPMCIELALEHAHQVHAPTAASPFAIETPTAHLFFESFRRFAGLDFYRLFIPSEVVSPSAPDLVYAHALACQLLMFCCTPSARALCAHSRDSRGWVVFQSYSIDMSCVCVCKPLQIQQMSASKGDHQPFLSFLLAHNGINFFPLKELSPDYFAACQTNHIAQIAHQSTTSTRMKTMEILRSVGMISNPAQPSEGFQQSALKAASAKVAWAELDQRPEPPLPLLMHRADASGKPRSYLSGFLLLLLLLLPNC